MGPPLPIVIPGGQLDVTAATTTVLVDKDVPLAPLVLDGSREGREAALRKRAPTDFTDVPTEVPTRKPTADFEEVALWAAASAPLAVDVAETALLPADGATEARLARLESSLLTERSSAQSFHSKVAELENKLTSERTEREAKIQAVLFEIGGMVNRLEASVSENQNVLQARLNRVEVGIPENQTILQARMVAIETRLQTLLQRAEESLAKNMADFGLQTIKDLKDISMVEGKLNQALPILDAPSLQTCREVAEIPSPSKTSALPARREEAVVSKFLSVMQTQNAPSSRSGSPLGIPTTAAVYVTPPRTRSTPSRVNVVPTTVHRALSPMAPKVAHCPKGHFLCAGEAPYSGNCDLCGVSFQLGTSVRRCGDCRYDLCSHCGSSVGSSIGVPVPIKQLPCVAAMTSSSISSSARSSNPAGTQAPPHRILMTSQGVTRHRPRNDSFTPRSQSASSLVKPVGARNHARSVDITKCPSTGLMHNEGGPPCTFCDILQRARMISR